MENVIDEIIDQQFSLITVMTIFKYAGHTIATGTVQTVCIAQGTIRIKLTPHKFN